MSKKLKEYVITFRTTLIPIYNIVNPYDDHDIANMSNGMRYVFKEGELKSFRVSAPNKRVAESLLAVELFQRVMGKDIDGGYKPFVINGLQNIETIVEVKKDEE